MRQTQPNKILGIAITQQGFLVAEIARVEERLEVRRCAEFACLHQEPGSISGAGEPFAQFLRQNGFTARRAVFGLPANWVMVKSKELPPSDETLAASVLRLQAETDFSPELKNLTYDYVGKPDRQHTSQVLLMAVSGDRLAEINALAQAARLTVVAITPSIVALAAASRTLVSPEGVVVSVDERSMEFVVCHGGGWQRVRHVALVGGQGGAISAEAPGASTNTQSIAQEVAAELRRALATLPQNGTPMTARKLVLWDGSSLNAADRDLISTRIGLTIDDHRLSALGVQSTQPDAARFTAAIAIAAAAASDQAPAVDFAHSRLAPPSTTSLRRKIIWSSVAAGIVVLLIAALVIDTYLKTSEIAAIQTKRASIKQSVAAARAFDTHFAIARNWYGSDPIFISCLQYITLAFPDDGSAWAINVELKDDLNAQMQPIAPGSRQMYLHVGNDFKGQLSGKAINRNAAQAIADRLKQGAGTKDAAEGDEKKDSHGVAVDKGKFKNVALLDVRDLGRNTTGVSFLISFEFAGSEAANVNH